MNGNKTVLGGGAICAPAMVYLILSAITLIAVSVIKFSAMSILFKVIFIALWTFLLNFLCENGYAIISWILVILPIIFMAATTFIAIDCMRYSKKCEDKKNYANNKR